MPAGNYTFTIEQGATFDIELLYRDANGDPVDLSGYSARMQIRQTIESSDYIISLSSSLEADGTGINMSGSSGANPPTSGSMGLYISAVSSSALDFTTPAFYDLEIVSGSRVDRILQGKVKLSKEVTR